MDFVEDIIHKLLKTLQKLRELKEGAKVDFITIGKKVTWRLRRVNQNITGVFTDMPDVNIRLSDIFPLSKLVMEEYRNQKYKKFICLIRILLLLLRKIL